MSNKKLAILGLAALVMIIGAILQSKLSSRKPLSKGRINTNLIQGLNPDDIAEIIIGKGDDTVNLKRIGRDFVISSKADYPAEVSKINNLLTGLLDIKTIEKITNNPQNHDDLEVTEEKAKNVVKFLDKNGKLITGVVIGKRTDAGSSYVRLASADGVYITEQSPWIQTAALDYADKNLFGVKRNDILSVTIAGPNGTFTLRSEPNSSEITLENMPEGKKLSNYHKQVFAALGSLSFDDVIKTDSANDLTFNHSFICRLQDSTVYTLEIAQKSDNQTYIKCSAEFTDTTSVTKKRDVVESEEVLKEKEAKLQAREATMKFNKDHENWIYKIPGYKAKDLTAGLDSILENQIKPENRDKEPNETNLPEISE